MAGGWATFRSGIQSFALVLTRAFSTSYKGRSGHQNSMPTKRPLAQPRMPQLKTYTTCSPLPQLVQRSSWFGGFWAKHRLRKQDTDNKHGQSLARNSTGVPERPFGWTTSVGQDPDDSLYHMDSGRDRLNACDPQEGPTDRQYEDIILQALFLGYDRIRQTYLERRDFNLANIRRMMAVIYGTTYPVRVIKGHHGPRRRNAGGGPGPS